MVSLRIIVKYSRLFRGLFQCPHQTAGIPTIDRVASHCNAAQKSAAEAVHYLPPVDILIGEEPVEHAFLAGEHLTKNATREVETIFDSKGTGPSVQGPDWP